MSKELSHFDAEGASHMVDVGAKEITHRMALASGMIRMSAETLKLVRNRTISKKGDVLEVARLAGIMAAKRTAELIPLCHTLPLDAVKIEFEFEENPSPPAPLPQGERGVYSSSPARGEGQMGSRVAGVDRREPPAAATVRIEAEVRCTGKTGVEMEALTAVSVAALTIYDMCKSAERGITIEQIRLEEKAGGKSGHWKAKN